MKIETRIRKTILVFSDQKSLILEGLSKLQTFLSTLLKKDCVASVP